MNLDQAAVFGVLLLTLVLFLSGRLRHDMVAILALLTLTLVEIIPAREAFTGFGHPAVITVAGVLVVSRGLQNSGLVDELARRLGGLGSTTAQQVPLLSGSVAVMSSFMNNVGALALLMPVAIRLAKRVNSPPSALLMPLAFGSLLGGLTTLIGTPPNIIVSTFRQDALGEPFRVFDFTPVGGVIALAGLAFISLVGWRLLPARRQGGAGSFDIAPYVSELRVPEGSSLVGRPLREIGRRVEADLSVMALMRRGERFQSPTGHETLMDGDLLTIKADHEALDSLVSDAGLEIEGHNDVAEAEESELGEMDLVEAIVGFQSMLVGRTARSLRLRRRFGLDLLAVSRESASFYERLQNVQLHAGDVVLLQGPSDGVQEALSRLGCLPLAERGLRIGQPRRVLVAVVLFGAAIALAATGVVAIQVAFIAAAVVFILLGLVGPAEVYESIDWPVIVLLAAMIPVAGALQSTGAADLVATEIAEVVTGQPAWVALLIILVGTMFLSDLVNNAASALVMAPISLSVAEDLGASPDRFLMAVAIGASSAFLTPIGHQSNTLVMSPGGYKFGDYARMGLPVEIIIVAVAMPLLMLIW